MALIALRQLLVHGATPAARQRSIRSGFCSVMMDRSLKENVKTPARAAQNPTQDRGGPS